MKVFSVYERNGSTGQKVCFRRRVSERKVNECEKPHRRGSEAGERVQKDTVMRIQERTGEQRFLYS